MKGFAVAVFLLPSVAFAFPSVGKRYDNGTSPDTNNTTPDDDKPAPIPDMESYPAPVCIPGKYQCKYDTEKGWGWEVCSTENKWVYGGSCAASETCTYNPLTGSPYCVPSPPPQPEEPEKECYPNKYQCAYTEEKGWYINSCGADGHWKHELDCKPEETCTYSAWGGNPYCTPKKGSTLCTPGTYQCSYDSEKSIWGWQVCTVDGKWVNGGYCKSSETCSFNALNGSPYCL